MSRILTQAQIELRNSRSRRAFVRTELHCPRCGQTTVYAEEGPGDTEYGEQNACLRCGLAFTIQEAPTPPEWPCGEMAVQYLQNGGTVTVG
jgi:ribosomal protein S27AE